jgi:hypothetical protein
MLSAIRRRVTYANAAATLALVFVMTGGAYAANKYLISSTKQISPKVLKALKGNVGAGGAPGAVGPAGPGGVTGPGGPQGPGGPAGPAGPKGETGPKGADGKNGTTGFTKTLPSEQSERGVWSVVFSATAAGQFISDPISYNIPLAAAPQAKALNNFIGPEEGEGEANEKKTAIPSHCKGTVAKPEAVPGNLCVFTSKAVNATAAEALGALFLDPQSGAGEAAGPAGAVLVFEAKAEGLVLADGTWAVTAE